jgi:AAA family ATP:ADP antiporter
VHFYGELARRVELRKLLVIVYLFFISNLALFAVLARMEVQIGLVFFLWVGVFSYTVVAQFWALAADLYRAEQGKRLFPIIGGGSSLGAVVGASLAKALVQYGPHVLMATSVALLLVCVGLILRLERREAPKPSEAVDAGEAELSTEGAFKLLFSDKYLLLIAGMVVFLNWVNSSGEYLLDRTLLVAAEAAQVAGEDPKVFIGEFKADYFGWYNLIGVLLQLFLVSRILERLGVRRALYFLPTFALFAYATAFFFPVLAVMRLVKIGENSVQYSLQDTTRHALFLVATRAEKFVGKTATDTVFVRLGAISSALVVFLGTRADLSIASFAAVNAVLALGWLAVVFFIGKEHLRRSKDEVAPAAG